MYGALANMWSRRSMITSLGDSGLPVFHAGHWDWQRPHSVQVVKSSMPFQVKSSILPRPKTSSSPGFSKSIGLPPDSIGSSGPRASGSRLNVTLSGASPMCRCLECSTMSRKVSMTPMCNSRAIDSIARLALSPSGCSAAPTRCEANAPLPYGKLPVFTADPRNSRYVQMTLKIMNRISQAPPRCEP